MSQIRRLIGNTGFRPTVANQSHIVKVADTMQSTTKFVGLDVSKEKIAVAIADAGRGETRFWGTIQNTPSEVKTLFSKLDNPSRIEACYEVEKDEFVPQDLSLDLCDHASSSGERGMFKGYVFKKILI